jgi:hypothetical protein
VRTLLLSLFVVAACGGTQHDAGPPPPGPDAAPALAMDPDTARETVAGLVDFWTAMAAIVDQRQGDCDAMATDLDTLFATTTELFEVVHEAELDPDANAMLARVAQAHAAEITPLTDRISVGLATCKDSPKLVDTMSRMPEL